MKDSGEKITVYAPLNGKVVSLKDVEDDVFNQGMMGEGIAIIPDEDTLYSPIEGTVKMVFKTLHAIGLETKNGAELLIHLGLDTVNLKGKYFKALTKEGAKVNVGDPLITFKTKKILRKGYSLTTPITITNMNDYSIELIQQNDTVKVGNPLFTVSRS